MVYVNNSVIPITNIGQTALQCVTDKRPCCKNSAVGQWYFPNGTTVPIQGVATTFYRARGDDGTVNLNRQVNSNIVSPSGLFCCVVPDAVGVDEIVCANVAESRTMCLCNLKMFQQQMQVYIRSLISVCTSQWSHACYFYICLHS